MIWHLIEILRVEGQRDHDGTTWTWIDGLWRNEWTGQEVRRYIANNGNPVI